METLVKGNKGTMDDMGTWVLENIGTRGHIGIMDSYVVRNIGTAKHTYWKKHGNLQLLGTYLSGNIGG